MVRDRLVRTASGSSTSQPPIDTTIDELMEGTADLIKLSNSENALPVIMTILAPTSQVRQGKRSVEKKIRRTRGKE